MSGWSEESDRFGATWRLQLRMDQVLHQQKTGHQEIILFENALFGRVLALDGIIQTTERDEFFYHEMLVHLPAFTHGNVRQALIIGGGDGGALEELLKHRTVEHVTMVEIDEGVVTFSKTHLKAICGKAFDDPRLNLVIADGVDWVASSQERFDLILIDSTDPVGPGEVLFTESFYFACAGLLAQGGLLVTQNAVPFSEPESLSQPVAALRKAFDETLCYRVAVPSFFGGEMVFVMAGQNREAMTAAPEVLERRFAEAGIETDYYTPAVHAGALALPPYLERLLPAPAAIPAVQL